MGQRWPLVLIALCRAELAVLASLCRAVRAALASLCRAALASSVDLPLRGSEAKTASGMAGHVQRGMWKDSGGCSEDEELST